MGRKRQVNKKNLLETSEFDAIKEEHSEVLAFAIDKLGGSIKNLNGKSLRQDLIKTVVTVGSLIIVIITILGFLTTFGGWKKENEIQIKTNCETIAEHKEKIGVNHEAIGTIESDVRVIRVKQDVMSDNIKKILKKVE